MLSASGTSTIQSVLAASGFYKDVLNYIVNAATTAGTHQRFLDASGLPASEGCAGCRGLCTAAGHLRIRRDCTGQRRSRQGQGRHAQLPAGVRRYRFRSACELHVLRCVHRDRRRWLPYNSKNAYNLAPYFEQGPYSASVSYNWRSSYLAGGYVAGAPATYVDSYKELDASAGYQFNKNFSVNLDMLNLLNSKYYAYLGSKTQLSEEYVTGRQFMLERALQVLMLM
jgi:iron complex outermembrane receptor protein